MPRLRARGAGAARRHALLVVSAPPRAPSPAERELAELLGRLSELEAETARLSESLLRFRDERRARLGAAEEELFAAKRLEARLSRLEREAEEWAEGPRAPAMRRGRRKARSGVPFRAAPAAPTEERAPWLSLKELYRELARKLHPDLAATDAERSQRSELMARVNAAYAREDRVLLELLHEQAEPGPGTHEPSPSLRASHAERRLATLAPMVASLDKALARLRASSSFKELSAAERAAARGSDFFAESASAARRAARDAVRAAFELAERLDGTLRVYRARSIAPPARKTSRRASRDALPAERLTRDAILLPLEARVTDESRQLSRRLEAAAAKEKWQVILSLFALFGEASPEPPPGLSTFASARARYELLRHEYPASPPFERAILELPPHLEVGAREYAKRLVFGIQVKKPEQLAGVRLALASNAVAPLARAVLSVMGPEERCAECRAPLLFVHVFRARGIDEVHALACPSCGAVLQSYRSFGSPVGVEALAPHAVALGVVAEQPVAIGASTVILGLLGNEQRRSNAQLVLDRIATLFLDEVSPELRGHAHLAANRKRLAPSTPIQPGRRVRLGLSKDAPLTIEELERELLARARSRFRARSENARKRAGA